MPKRQETLSDIIKAAGLSTQPGRSGPNLGDRTTTRSRFWSEIDRVYRALGGLKELCPLGAGSWDARVGNTAIELDEEQHFNRYRLLTLESRLYTDIPFPLIEYRAYCDAHEGRCLAKASHGKYWSSPSSIAQFGPAGSPGDLTLPVHRVGNNEPFTIF